MVDNIFSKFYAAFQKNPSYSHGLGQMVNLTLFAKDFKLPKFFINKALFYLHTDFKLYALYSHFFAFAETVLSHKTNYSKEPISAS